jgi:hypothetical protein
MRMILPNGEERFYGNGEDIEPPVPKGEGPRGRDLCSTGPCTHARLWVHVQV